jgi:hypothetical protein
VLKGACAAFPSSSWKAASFLFLWRAWRRRSACTQSGGLFDDAIESMFSAFSLSGIADFIQNDVLDAAAMIAMLLTRSGWLIPASQLRCDCCRGICQSF